MNNIIFTTPSRGVYGKKVSLPHKSHTALEHPQDYPSPKLGKKNSHLTKKLVRSKPSDCQNTRTKFYTNSLKLGLVDESINIF